MFATRRIGQVLLASFLGGLNGVWPTPAPAAGLQDAYIVDPTFNNTKAFRVTIPASWHFAGVLYQAGKCVPYPAGVYKATSPDGLSFGEALPPFGWVWGSGPRVAAMANAGCLPIKPRTTAQEFLKILAATLKVRYVDAEPVPASDNAKAQAEVRRAQASVAGRYASMHLTPPTVTVELARALVQFKNGTFAMKGLLSTSVTCNETTYAGMRSMLRGMADTASSTVDQCTAYVTYVGAPENQFTDVVRRWEAPGIGGHGGEKDWFAAYVQRSNAQSEKFIEDGNARFAQRYAQNAQQFSQLQARAQQFQHDQDVRQEMHNQFLDTMQRGTDSSMANARAGMDARSTAASDMVDFSLDQRTVLDPNSGQISKVSSSYNHTWIDSTGKHAYQTDNANANPNGVLPGNWTQQQYVHGNGS